MTPTIIMLQKQGVRLQEPTTLAQSVDLKTTLLKHATKGSAKHVRVADMMQKIAPLISEKKARVTKARRHKKQDDYMDHSVAEYRAS